MQASCFCLSRLLRCAWQGSGSILYPTPRTAPNAQASCSCLSRLLRCAWQGSGSILYPTPRTTPTRRRVVPALVASYDMHGRAVGLFYTQHHMPPQTHRRVVPALVVSYDMHGRAVGLFYTQHHAPPQTRMLQVSTTSRFLNTFLISKFLLCFLSCVNNNNNRIQRCYSRFFTISSQHCKLSPTRTLKWPRHDRVQITCNTSSAYHVHFGLPVSVSCPGYTNNHRVSPVGVGLKEMHICFVGSQ